MNPTPNIGRDLLIGLTVALALAHSTAFGENNGDDPVIGWIGTPVVTGKVVNNSTNISSGSEVAYRTRYGSGFWDGNIEALMIDQRGQVREGNTPPRWRSPADQLNKMNWNSQRIVITSNGDSGAPFRWASLSSAERNTLGGNGQGPDLLNYIRGDQSNETPSGPLRARKSLLGDFIHTNIYYWEYSSSPGRPSTIFAGGNDGMLHAFDAETGKEKFAYVPSMILSKLPQLAQRNYKHTYFVDGQINIANVREDKKVSTLLVGGLGSGGAGLYCLDVSNPEVTNESHAASMVRWEVTAKNAFRDLGEIHGRVKIAKLSNGKAVAITGNGYNSANGSVASLFVIDLNTGGKVAEIIATTGGNGQVNGLSAPALLDTDNDGYADVAYAGDLLGNLWKFDLINFTAHRLFRTDKGRPITVEPVVVDHPNGGYLVVFGTGKVLEDADLADASKNYVYGIWDGAPKNNNHLLQQNLSGPILARNSYYRSITSRKPNWSDGRDMGWQVELPQGERLVGHIPFKNGDRFYFTSTNSTQSPAINWLNELNYTTGGFQGCAIFDINGNGTFCSNKASNEPNPGDLLPNGQAAVSVHLKDGHISQPLLVAVKRNAFLATIYNWNSSAPSASLLDVVPPKVKLPRKGAGISGGHFDFDVYINSNSKYANKLHVHEYDDLYNVIGVNMLSASVSTFNLNPNVLNNKKDKFKILVMNQYLNPAAQVAIGTNKYESVITWEGLAGAPGSTEQKNGRLTVSSARSVLNNLTAFSTKSIKTLTFALPTDAFSSKNWWGNGVKDVRAGLIPTQTDCVNRVSGDGSTTTGPNGERFDGALTFQIIDGDTPASALELNNPKDVRYGWRVKRSEFLKYVYGEYTTFWHHPNGACYGKNGWSQAPAQDFSGGGPGPGGPGGPGPGGPGGPKGGGGKQGNDPTSGDFNGGDGFEDATVVSDTTKSFTINGVPTTEQVIKYSDGSTYTLTKSFHTDGSVWAKQDMPDGKKGAFVCIENCSVSGFVTPPEVPYEDNPASGPANHRESWAEILK